MIVTINCPSKLSSLMLKGRDPFVGLLTLIFFLFVSIGIINHEMWRDELQAWLIARDSESVGDLFRHIKYERHAALWFLCLYILSRFTHNPFAMQLLHLVLATGVVFLFARFSPFTRIQKVLFSFGYFPLYEYAVISRSYVMGFLLIFVFCTLYQKDNQNHLGLSLTLGLLANSSFYGLIIAIAMGFTLALEYLTSPSIKKSSHQRCISGASLLIFTLAVMVAICLLIPPSNYRGWDELLAGGVTIQESKRYYLVRTLFKIWESYLPLPNPFNYHFWGSNILDALPEVIARRSSIVFSLSLLIYSSIVLMRKFTALFLYLSGTLAILLFTYTYFLGSIRHSGHLFILLLACLWISDSVLESRRPVSSVKKSIQYFSRYKNPFLSTILFIHVIAGIYAMCMDLFNPFSESKNVASFIKKHAKSDMLIVGSPDVIVSPITAYLDQKIYYPESGILGTFIIWNNQRENRNKRETFQRIDQLVKLENKDVIFVSSDKLEGAVPDVKVSKLAEFNNSICGENYYLYLIQR